MVRLDYFYLAMWLVLGWFGLIALWQIGQVPETILIPASSALAGALLLAAIPAVRVGRRSALVATTFFTGALVAWGLGFADEKSRAAEFPYWAAAFGAAGLLVHRPLVKLGESERPVLAILAAPMALAWLIVYFSGDAGGSGSLADFLVSRFGLTFEQAQVAIVAIRKTLHFAVYGSLAWLVYRAARLGKSSLNSAAALGMAFGTILAISDELRQDYYPSRTASQWDVLLDMAGMAAFVGIAMYRERSKGPKSSTPGPEGRTLE